jgi:hypothetical protein
LDASKFYFLLRVFNHSHYQHRHTKSEDEKRVNMAPKLTEDEIDDLLYFARIGDKAEFSTLEDELCKRESVSEVQLLEAAKDEESGNGILHMAAANGHSGTERVCVLAIMS